MRTSVGANKKLQLFTKKLVRKAKINQRKVSALAIVLQSSTSVKFYVVKPAIRLETANLHPKVCE